MNQKCHHLVFLKILSTVTPECVVDNWEEIMFIYGFWNEFTLTQMQNTFGNTGQKLEAITISGATGTPSVGYIALFQFGTNQNKTWNRIKNKQPMQKLILQCKNWDLSVVFELTCFSKWRIFSLVSSFS